MEKEAEAETLPRQLYRETSIPDSTSASVSVSAKTRDLLKRYGLALALAGLALYLCEMFPFREGTSIYQLPIAAIVLSGWYGGRGPGWLVHHSSAQSESYTVSSLRRIRSNCRRTMR